MKAAARSRWLTIVPVLGLALLLAWRLGIWAHRVVITLAHPFQFDPTEGILLSELVLLNQKVNIYAPFTPDRFISAPYPPVYYAMVAPLLRLTGINFIAGRAVALLAAVAIAVLVCLIVWRRRDVSRTIGVLAGLIWLASTPLLVWSTRLKPDLIAVAFVLLGVWLALGWQGKPLEPGKMLRDRRLWAVVIAFSLGFYSKQSAMAGGLAVGVWLLGRNWRAGVVYGIVQALALAVPFAVLDLVTRHGFWIHMIDYHGLPWSAARWLGIVRDMTTFHWALTLFAVGFAVVGLRRWELAAVYVVAAFGASFSGGTFGGFHNHALELLAVLCLGAGLLIAEVWQRPLWRGLALTVLGAQVATFALTPDWLAYELQNLPDAAVTNRMLGVQNVVRGVPGPVWGDNVGLLVMTGKPVPFNDPLVMAQAAQLGWWDDSRFTELLRTGGFGAVIWRGDVLEGKRPNDLSPGQFEALRAGYQIRYRDTPLVYMPKTTP